MMTSDGNQHDHVVVLTDEERGLLLHMLKRSLVEVIGEKRKTDLREFRHAVAHERALIEHMMSKVQSS